MASALGANGDYFAGEFGSIQQNGNSDDGPAINQALTVIAAFGGGRLIFSPGVTVMVGTTIQMPSNTGLVIPRSCTFKAKTGLSGPMIQFTGSYGGIEGNGVINGFGIATNCINVHSAILTTLQGIQVKGATQHGILTDGSATDNHYEGIDARDNSAGNVGTYFGIAFAGTASHNTTTNCRGFDTLGAAGSQQSGWGEVAGMTGDYNVYSGCDFSGNVSAAAPPTVGANSGSTTTGIFTAPTIVGRITANTVGASAKPLLNFVPATLVANAYPVTTLSGTGNQIKTLFTVTGLPAGAVAASLMVAYAPTSPVSADGAALYQTAAQVAASLAVTVQRDSFVGVIETGGVLPVTAGASNQLAYLITAAAGWSLFIYLLGWYEPT